MAGRRACALAGLGATLALAAGPCARADDALRGAATQDGCAAEEASCAMLLGVSVEGARAIAAADLALAYEPYLAQSVSIGDLARIAQAMTDRYRGRGYFLTRAVVPAQDLSNGLARIVVVEGRISEVRIEGEAARAVAPFFRGVDAAQIADLRDLDARIARAGDAPGVSVRSRIEPDINDPHLHRLIITATLKPLEAFATLDNRGADTVGPLQAYGRAAWNSAFMARDQLAFSAFVTPDDLSEFALLEASYGVMFAHGGQISLSASASRAHDGVNTASSDVGGDGASVSVRYAHPILRRRNVGLWWRAAFDARHIEYDWRGGGDFADEVRAVRGGVRGFLDEDGRATAFAAQLSWGLDILGASSASPVGRSRFDADGQFGKFNLHVDHFQPIGRYFGLYGSLDGQVADGPLLSSEEFSIGAAPYGRAYDYGEISGDDAIAASLEARAGFDPDGALVSFLQGYAFADIAQVWNYNTPPGADETSLSSAGVGMRITLHDRLTAQIEGARPLSRTPSLEGDKDWRQTFSITANY